MSNGLFFLLGCLFLHLIKQDGTETISDGKKAVKHRYFLSVLARISPLRGETSDAVIRSFPLASGPSLTFSSCISLCPVGNPKFGVHSFFFVPPLPQKGINLFVTELSLALLI